MMSNKSFRIQMRQLADTEVVHGESSETDLASIDDVEANLEDSALEDADVTLNLLADEDDDDDFTTLKNALRLKRPELYFQ